MAIADDILDRFIRHATFIERLKTQQVREIVALFNDEVIPLLIKRIRRVGTSAKAVKRLKTERTRYRKIIKRGNKIIKRRLKSNLREVALMEGEFSATAMSKEMPFQFNFVVPAAPILEQIVTKTKIRGKLLNDFFNELGTKLESQVSSRINVGLVEGQSIDDITRAIRGTAKTGFRNGILEGTRREVAAVVRTAVNHTVTQAREETYKANDDVIKEVRYVATLDSKTTVICAGLDGEVFPIGEGPRPPQHFQCRSTTTAVVKSFKELGFDNLKELPPKTRAAAPIGQREIKELRRAGATKAEIRTMQRSLNGQVPATETYGTWLKRQPGDTQNKVLGPTRAKLFREGKVKINRFTNDNNRPLNLNEIRELEGLTERDIKVVRTRSKK
ncbi:MAG: hypothetical protein FVQ84_08470 [Planctomycetes bacterium]|nr:hypothetical protein [Planctomycetota bacterium]